MSLIKKLIPGSIKIKIRNLALQGNNVECPICEQTFITFLPFGVPPAPLRANAHCPNCNSLERTRMYWKYITEKTDILTRKSTILHVAPEKSLFNRFVSLPNIKYVPVDKFTKGYSYPKETINMDITNMSFSDNTFDFILCSHVLEHIPDDRKAMQELYRVMKPGGMGILQVPIKLNMEKTYEDDSITTPEERQKAFGQHDHVRWYGKDYITRLENAGFKVELDDFSVKASEYDKFRFGYGKGEPLFIVKKV